MGRHGPYRVLSPFPTRSVWHIGTLRKRLFGNLQSDPARLPHWKKAAAKKKAEQDCAKKKAPVKKKSDQKKAPAKKK